MKSHTAPSLLVSKKKAFALVLVLTVLALMTMLMTGMLAWSFGESRRTKHFVNQFRLEALREWSVNMVISQLRAGTFVDATKTWASQPGAIRIFGATPGQEGRSVLEQVRKLYSSAAMVEGESFSPDADQAPADWKTKGGLYVDLNAPRTEGNSTTSRKVYPILSPELVDTVSGLELPVDGSGAADATMPVRWLYVLQDGSVAIPQSQSGDTVTFVPGSGVSEENPIVGRVAFWADDESSKVNLNTTSEGTHWDHPLTNSKSDRGDAANIATNPASGKYGYASSLPQRGEYSRYPGHPAESSLSPVFEKMLFPANTSMSVMPVAADLGKYYAITPRVSLGGSQGGTIQSYYTTQPVSDSERLFASVDEVLFKHSTGSPGVRQMNSFNVSGSSVSQLSQNLSRIEFVTTTRSRSPELTAVGTPKVALWPFYANEGDRNVVDNVIAWCSTLNRHPYYFQRAKRSDASQSLASYDASAFSTSADFALQRNQQVYDYLYRMMGKPIPGFSNASFSSKYGSDRSTILTGMMDMIRSNFNVFSRNMKTANGNGYEFTSLNGLGEFHITPMRIQRNGVDSKGFGMCPTITEVALVTYATRAEATPSDAGLPNRATHVQSFLMFEIYKPSPSMPHQSPCIEVEVAGLQNFRINNQSLNMPSVAKQWWDARQAWGVWGSFVNHSPLILQYRGDDGLRKTTGSGYLKFSMISSEIALSGGAAASNTMSFTGGDLVIKVRNNPKAGGRNEEIQTLTVNFPSSNAWPVPRATSASQLPKTYDQRIDLAEAAGNVDLSGVSDASLYQQMNSHTKDTRQILLENYDVVRSVQVSATGPSKGDYRMIAGLTSVPSTYFAPHADYDKSEWQSRSAHSLRDDKFSAHGMPGWNSRNNTTSAELSAANVARPSNISTAGRLVADAPYGLTAVPPVAQGMTAALNRNNRPGDWENGLGILPDGAFVRRSNESTSSRSYIGGQPKQDSSYYLTGYYYHDDTGIDFAPNRQIASAVLLGALPTGLLSGQPWQTLLFCPNPAARTTTSLNAPTGTDHRGFEFPRDHHMLEMFWMPAVEPYAISEPCSTAGKVNLNYEMLPFRQIKRRTALHSVMKSLRMTAIPRSAAATYKSPTTSSQEFQYKVNLDAEKGTLRGFERRFSSGDIFRSASEICEIFLVPEKKPTSQLHSGVSYPATSVTPEYSNMVSWWNEMQLTGDNTREMPYNHIYPRLTTQSNAYTVHYRVQALKKARSTDPAVWVEGRDAVEGEQRGSVQVDRFVQLNNATIPDFALSTNEGRTMNEFTWLRIVGARRF